MSFRFAKRGLENLSSLVIEEVSVKENLKISDCLIKI